MPDLRDLMSEMLVDEPELPTILEHVIADGRRARRRRRAGWVAVSGCFVLVAGVSTLVVLDLVPGGSTGNSASTEAALKGLAIVAANAPGDGLEPGKYLHLVDRITSGSDVSVYESWVSSDGDIWRRDVDGADTTYQLFPPSGVPGDLSDATPQLLASLPTDPDQLDHYLESHVTGSSSKDEAMFVAVGDLMRTGYVPPALRSALVQVLQTVGNITARTTQDRQGDDALKITFTDPTGESGPTSLLFDPTNAALIEEQDGPLFTMDYSDKGLVGAVPSDVIAHTGTAPTSPQPTGGSPTPIPTSTER